MFKRSSIEYLHKWKDRSDRKPLILRGARQVGKTSLVRMFSKSFSTYIELNLERREDAGIFERGMTFSQIVESIFFRINLRQTEQSVLIFIDEVQNSPEAVRILRFFYEERPDLYVIAAGSMLESMIGKTISFPVGRVEYLAIRPCSFIEFLSATAEEESIRLIREQNIPPYVHDHLTALFNRYTLIGGMPEVVAEYAQNMDLVALNRIYESLLTSYMDDVEKYAGNLSIERVLRHLISTAFPFASSRIRFEGFGASHYKSREVGEGFRILEKVWLMNLIYPVESTSLPLLPNLKKAPKLHLLDVGLVNYFARISMEVFESKDIVDVYRGKVAEQIVGQELLTNETSVLAKLYFWTKEERTAQAEVDYIFQVDNYLVPVEVKSGSTGRLRSLHQFIDQSPLKLAVRVWNKPLKVETTMTLNKTSFTLINIPYYLVWNLRGILQSFIRKA